MDKFKIEIIDNQISNCYQINLYRLGRVNKWYQMEKFDWRVESRQILGKKYSCPEIYKKRITIEEYFEREVKRELGRDGLVEVHRIVITKQ